MLFKHNRRYYNVLQGGMVVVASFPKACDVLLGSPGGLLDLFSPDKRTEFKLKYLKNLLDNNNIICLQEVTKKPELCLSAVTDEEGHTLENEDESGRGLCECWGTIFRARQEGPRHHQHEEILRFVQQAPDDINWTVDHADFDDLLALKKDSAPGPDGIPYSVHRCAGGLGSKFLFRAYKAVLEEVIFLIVLLKVGPSLSLRLLIPMISEGLFDHLMHFVR